MEQQKIKFVQLSNGTVLDLDNIAFILHAGVNEYGVLPKMSVAGAQAVPKLDAHEVSELVQGLAEAGLALVIKKLPRTEAPAANEKRIATA